MLVVVGCLKSQDGYARRDEGAPVSNCLVPGYEPGDHVSLSSPVESAEAVGIKGDAVNVPSDWIDLRYTADENVVNRLRFHKRRLLRSHDVSPARLLFSEAQRTASHATGRPASNRSFHLCRLGVQIVNPHSLSSSSQATDPAGTGARIPVSAGHLSPIGVS